MADNIDLGLSFDEDDYENVAAEDADVFQRSKDYEHTFNEVCELCDRRHFPGLKVPEPFQKQLKKHLRDLTVEEAQRQIDQIDDIATWQLPSQVSSIAIETESKAAKDQQGVVFLRSLADTLNEITGGELTKKIVIGGLEQKIIDIHKSIKDVDKIYDDLFIAEDDTDRGTIAGTVRDLLEFSRGVRKKRLDNLINMYNDECKDKGVEPKASIIKEGKFDEESALGNIVDLLEGNEKL